MKQLEVVTSVQITQIINVPDDYDDDNAVQDAEDRSASVFDDIKPVIMCTLADACAPDNICLCKSQVFIHDGDCINKED